MKAPLLALLLLGTTLCLNAQLATVSCVNGRYTNDVFTNVTKTSGVIYGYNTTTDYSTNTVYNQTLKLDFYEPAGDLAVQRPLIILAFGGGFIQGQRSDMEPICIALAKKGYTTATIDYRLIYNSLANEYAVANDPNLLIDEVVKASVDMKAAIRFLKQNAISYKIDTAKIFIGGGSAGAIAALQTAYADDINEAPGFATAYNNNGGFEGNTDLPAPNSLRQSHNAKGIAGVFNISGGVVDTLLLDANNPPIYSAQGDADEVVPYNYGQLSYNGISAPLYLYGSNPITQRARNIGLKNELYTIPGGTHQSPSQEPYISHIISGVAAFGQSIVCGLALPVSLTSFNVESNNNCSGILNWQIATEINNSYYEIEMSTDGTNFSKVASVSSKNSTNGSNYSYKVEGYKQPTWFRLKMTDKDGTYTYSNVQKYNPQCGPSLQVFPNPAKTSATITGLNVNMQVNVINAEGKLLWTKKATAYTLQIPLSTFSKGLLLIQVKDSNGNTVTNTRLIKN
jgi:hypothetical protein